MHGSDQLALMATPFEEVLARVEMHNLAHKGYFSSREILTCLDAGITTTEPRLVSSGKGGKGIYVKAKISYEPDKVVYRCPAGEALSHHNTTKEDSLQLRRYWTGECGNCLIKSRCTTGRERRITRWE